MNGHGGKRAGAGRPKGSGDIRTPSQRGTLGMRGVIGEGRVAVAYAYRSHGVGVNIAPVRTRGGDPMYIDRTRRNIERTPNTGAPSDAAAIRAARFDAYDGTRGVALWRAQRVRYTGGEAWKRAQRARIVAARAALDSGAYVPHVCPREHRDVTRKCRCASFGGERHEHRRDDGRAPRATQGGTCGALHRDAYGVRVPCATCDASARAYDAVRARIARDDNQVAA